MNGIVSGTRPILLAALVVSICCWWMFSASVPRSTVMVTVGGSQVLRSCQNSVRRAITRTNTSVGLVDAHGLGCCCYDAMATAPWEASEELNEFSPQLKWSSRRQSAEDAERAAEGQTAGSVTPAGRCPSAVRGYTQPGVSASPIASRVMTPGNIPHTSVRRYSETGEAPTPFSHSPVEIRWRRIVFISLTRTHTNIITCDKADLLSWFVLDHHGWENLLRVTDDDVGAHAGRRYDPARGGTGEAGGAGAGALWR